MALSVKNTEGWHAQLKLGFSCKDGRTVLSDRFHKGPLQVQRPFYPEDNGSCHLYLLHPPGGVVGGDVLDINIHLGSGCQVLITTPAATKFYKNHGKKSFLHQKIRVDDDAFVEWFPLETIFFDNASVEITTQVELIGNAGFLGWEINCYGRPACGELYSQGSIRQRFEIWRDNKPLLLERLLIEEESPVLSARWGFDGYPVSACLVGVNVGSEVLSELRDITDKMGNEALCSVTILAHDVLVCRFLGQQAEQARNYFTNLWQVLRPLLSGRSVCAPRIWDT